MSLDDKSSWNGGCYSGFFWSASCGDDEDSSALVVSAGSRSMGDVGGAEISVAFGAGTGCGGVRLQHPYFLD